jgi:hypothetical protein
VISFGGTALLAAIVALILAAIFSLLRRAWRYPTPDDIAWAAGAGPDQSGDPPTGDLRGPCQPELTALYSAYLSRQTRHQLAGAAIAGILALIIQARLYYGVWLGPAGPAMPLDPIFACLAGTVIGGLLAQSYRLRPGRDGTPVSARLEARPDRPGKAPRRWSWALVAGCLGVGLAVGAATNHWSPLWCAAIGAAIVALAELTQDAIWSRSRPLLAAPVMRADARLRVVSAGSLAWTQLAAGLLTAAWVFGTLPDPDLGVLSWLPLIATFWAVHRSSLQAPRSRRRPRNSVRL